MSKNKFVVDDTKQQVQFETQAGECPYCHSNNINFEGPDACDEMIYYEGHCCDCGNDFTEWYDITFNSTYGLPLKTKKKGKK